MNHLPGHILIVSNYLVAWHNKTISGALVDLCGELEKLGKAGALAGAAELLSQAEATYEEIKTALQII